MASSDFFKELISKYSHVLRLHSLEDVNFCRWGGDSI